jgi:hypothetical protein
MNNKGKEQKIVEMILSDPFINSLNELKRNYLENSPRKVLVKKDGTFEQVPSDEDPYITKINSQIEFRIEQIRDGFVY